MRDSETEMPWLCLYTKIRADPFLNHRTKVCSKVRDKDVCKCFQGFLKGQAAFWPTQKDKFNEESAPFCPPCVTLTLKQSGMEISGWRGYSLNS